MLIPVNGTHLSTGGWGFLPVPPYAASTLQQMPLSEFALW